MNTESFGKYKIKQYIIIVITFVGALRLSKVVPKDYFTRILFVKGPQTREPEIIAPLIMTNKDIHIIIVGDTYHMI